MMMTGSSPLKMDAKISKSVYMVVVLWKKDLRHRRDLALNRGCLHLRKTLCNLCSRERYRGPVFQTILLLDNALPALFEHRL